MAKVVDSIIAELILRDNGYTEGMLKVIETNKALRESYAGLEAVDAAVEQSATAPAAGEAASAKEINHALADRYDITQKLKVAEGENAAFLRSELEFHQRINVYRRAGLTDAEAVTRADAEALAVEKLRAEQAEKQTSRGGSNNVLRFAEGAGLGRTGGGLAAVGGIVAGATIAGVAELAKQGLEYAQSLKQDSDQLGLTTRDLQLYRTAAQQVGVTNEQFKTSFEQLGTNLGKAQEGAETQSRIFQRLHIDTGSAATGYKSLSEILPSLSDRLSQITDKTERQAIESALGGKELAALDPILSQGAAAFDAYGKSIERAGGILANSEIQQSAETAKKIALLNDQLQRDLASTVSHNADAIEDLAKALFSVADGALKAFAQLRLIDNLDVINGGTSARIREAITGTSRSADVQQNYREALASPQGRQALLAQNSQRLAALAAADKADPAENLDYITPGTKDVVNTPQARYAAYQKALGERATLLRVQRAYNAQANPRSVPVQPGRPDGNVLAPADKKGRKGKSAEELDAEEQARLKQFNDQLAALQEQALRAQESMTGDIQQQASIESAISEHSLQRQKDDIESTRRRNIDRGEDPAVANAHAAQLVAQAELTHGLQDQAREQQVAADVAKAQSAHLQTQLSISSDLLSDQLALAKMAKDRRAVETQLLANAKAQEKNDLTTQLATLKPGDPARQDVQKRLDNLDATYAGRQQGINQRDAGPLAQYAQSLPRTANQVQEAFQQAAVEGIGQMNGALDTAIGKMLHLHGLAGQLLEDFIKVGVQAAEGQLFGGAAGGSSSGGAGGFIGGIGKLLGGIFGGRGGSGGGASFTSTGDLISGGAPSSVGVGSLNLLGSLFHFANGGSGVIGGNPGVDQNTLSINGSPVAKVGAGELLSVTPNIGTANGKVAATHTTTIAPQHFDLRGAVVTQDLLDQMNSIGQAAADNGAHRGAAGGLALSKQHFAWQARRKLG